MVIFVSKRTKVQSVSVQTDQVLVILIMVTISKAVISGAFVGIYVITAEIYPSEMRTAAISCLNSSGKILGTLTPFIAHLVTRPFRGQLCIKAQYF